MGSTVQYDENGAIPFDHEAYVAEQGDAAAGAQSGNVDTSTDSAQSAQEISPVFADADEHFTNTDVPEGIPLAVLPDPEATGEDALVPDYSDYEGPSAVEAAEPVEPDAKADDVPKEFDPSEHTVAEVQEYLANADDDEQIRVLGAEEKGQARKSLIG